MQATYRVAFLLGRGGWCTFLFLAVAGSMVWGTPCLGSVSGAWLGIL
jgi:hypothetical protein